MPTAKVVIQINITSSEHKNEVTATPSQFLVSQNDWNNVNRTIVLTVVSNTPTKGDPEIQIRAVSLDQKYNSMPPVKFFATIVTVEDKPTVNIMKGPAVISPMKRSWDFVVSSNDSVFQLIGSLNGQPPEPLTCESFRTCNYRISQYLGKGSTYLGYGQFP